MQSRIARLGVVLVFALSGCGGSAPAQTAANARASTAAPSSTAAPAASGLDSRTGPVGPTEDATVLSITDGDTIRVDRGYGSEPVRYIGINAPEKGKPGGAEATARNAALVKKGSTVVLERDVSDTDKYDRLLRYIWIHNGSTWTLVNLELVKAGVAKAVAYPPDTRYQPILKAAQAVAKSAHLGVWSQPSGPTPAPTKRPFAGGGGGGSSGGGGGASCHPSYSPCLPIVGDLDCKDVRAMGKAPVTVKGPDEYRLDADHDGLGCE